MKLHAKIGDNKHEIEIKRDGRRLTAAVDGREYELEVSEPETNVLLFKHENKIYEAVVSPAAPGRSTHVRVGSEEFDVKLIDPKRLRGAKGDDADASGKAEIKTAMPGKVVRILVSQGDTVQKGDGVIVVEAMKMQNEMKAPKDGVIAEMRFSEGDSVSAGDVLVVIE